MKKDKRERQRGKTKKQNSSRTNKLIDKKRKEKDNCINNLNYLS